MAALTALSSSESRAPPSFLRRAGFRKVGLENDKAVGPAEAAPHGACEALVQEMARFDGNAVRHEHAFDDLLLLLLFCVRFQHSQHSRSDSVDLLFAVLQLQEQVPVQFHP